jgi:hypothetical protein
VTKFKVVIVVKNLVTPKAAAFVQQASHSSKLIKEKKLARDKRTSLFWRTVGVGDGEKPFYNVWTWSQCYKTFFLRRRQQGLQS